MDSGCGSEPGKVNVTWVPPPGASPISSVPRTSRTSVGATSSASPGCTVPAPSRSSPIGTVSVANPPKPPFAVPSGVQYAFETCCGGFLVTDGHHNRVLRVTLTGEVWKVDDV